MPKAKRQRRVITVKGERFELLDSNAQALKLDKYRIVNRVIDSLYVRVWLPKTASSWLEDSMTSWRETLKVWADKAPVVHLPGLGYYELWHGDRPYEFGLYGEQSAEIRVWNPERWNIPACANTGQFYVLFRSKFLQEYGIPGAMRFLDALENLMCSPDALAITSAPEAYRTVSRADLAVDYQMPDQMEWRMTDEYVARSPRLKKEAWLSPWNDTAENVLKTVFQNTQKNWRSFKNDGFVSQNPRGDNKGGLQYTTGLEGFNGEPSDTTLNPLSNRVSEFAHVPTIEAGASYLLKEFVNIMNEHIERQDFADVSRVIGSQKSIQTLYFGRFGSALYAREYNKSLSLAYQNKLYLGDVWRKNGWDCNTPVWRLEFSLSADALKEFWLPETGEWANLTHPMAMLENAPALWNWLTRTWLRHCEPSEDTNRSRWEPSIRWMALQNAWGKTNTLLRVSKLAKGEPEALKKVARGYLTSTTALTLEMEDDIPFGIAQDDRQARLEARGEAARTEFKAHAQELLEWADSDEFIPYLIDRRKRKGMDSLTDTELSAMARAGQIKRGKGS